jgi:hypothetical protein
MAPLLMRVLVLAPRAVLMSVSDSVSVLVLVAVLFTSLPFVLPSASGALDVVPLVAVAVEHGMEGEVVASWREAGVVVVEFCVAVAVADSDKDEVKVELGG